MPTIAPPRDRRPILKSFISGQVVAIWILTAVSTSLTLGSADAATERPPGQSLARCPTLVDALARLSCYDAVAKQADLVSDASSAFNRMELAAFKAERADLLTKPVRLSGRLGILGSFATLRSPDRIDNDPVWISIDRLKPERWRAIASECARRCMVTLSGRVSHVFSGIGVAAEVIEMDKP